MKIQKAENIIIYKKLIPYDVAHLILDGYMSYYHQFKRITKRGRYRFEERNWHGIQEDSRERIRLYRNIVGKTKESILTFLGEREANADLWKMTKRMYFEEIANFNTRNIAETFYNSVFRHCHPALGADKTLMFVNKTGSYREFRSTVPIAHTFHLVYPLASVIQQIFHYFKFDVPFENQQRDIQWISKTLETYFKQSGFEVTNARIEILKSIFYRNKSAYIIGRLLIDERVSPFVIPLLNEENGIYADCLLLHSDDVSPIYSYHRTYFLVDVDIVSETIDFLKSILPSKKVSELYNSIGFEKHGKTVFYREYLRHMRQTEDKFVLAPGIRGLVMSVFTLPSLNIVFKVIKDKFDPPKNRMNADTVKEKYNMVNLHDRVGRMTDTHMFEYLSFEKKRFSDDLLEELQKTIGSKLVITQDTITISHLYAEKRMIPLNIYIESATPDDLYEVIDEYGKAIKQLAAANIFPGDMLLKNFGVTRLKRVVFYDYDEIGLLTDFNFRYIPEPKNEYEEMSAEPYYHVGINDVFPEEFAYFLFRKGKAKQIFTELHSDLFDAQYWQKIQEKLKVGFVIDVFPYKEKHRHRHKYNTK